MCERSLSNDHKYESLDVTWIINEIRSTVQHPTTGKRSHQSRRNSPVLFKFSRGCGNNNYRVLNANKRTRSDCDNHHGTSSIPIVIQVVASSMLHRLTPVRESNIHEKQTAFRPGRGCVYQILAFLQLLEKRHIYTHITITTTILQSPFHQLKRCVRINPSNSAIQCSSPQGYAGEFREPPANIKMV